MSTFSPQLVTLCAFPNDARAREGRQELPEGIELFPLYEVPFSNTKQEVLKGYFATTLSTTATLYGTSSQPSGMAI
jgi:hypothetical protein